MMRRHSALTTRAQVARPLRVKHRVGRVEVAGVVLPVGPDLHVEQVVHQVVRHVGEHDADGRHREPAPVHVGVAIDREQTGDCGGDQGHGQHARPGEIEPLRNWV
jgi:hypothetical protein